LRRASGGGVGGATRPLPALRHTPAGAGDMGRADRDGKKKHDEGQPNIRYPFSRLREKVARRAG